MAEELGYRRVETRLCKLCTKLNIQVDEDAYHSALYDAYLTINVAFEMYIQTVGGDIMTED